MEASPSVPATSTMNAAVFRESIQHMRDERRDLLQQMRNLQKVGGNLRIKVKQASSRYDHEDHIVSKMQGNLKLSDSKVGGLCQEYCDRLEELHNIKKDHTLVETAIESEKNNRRAWQREWEEACRDLADKYREAYELFGSDSTLHTEEKLTRQQVVAHSTSIAGLDAECCSLQDRINELLKELDCVSLDNIFLANESAKHAQEILNLRSTMKNDLRLIAEKEMRRKEELLEITARYLNDD